MEVARHCWEHSLLSKGRGDKLHAMLQAQEMDGVRRRQIDLLGKERNSELGEYFKILILFFSCDSLSSSWLF